jgi:beta-lactamase superfamily II metal-dependent hydrolase
MGFEIDFLPVGEGSKAGDAIAIRHNLNGDYEAIIVDGGTDASGEALIEHVRSYYGINTPITDVISTHPDTDHACGLRPVLEKLPVKRLWLHGLWHHAAAMRELYSDGRWTEEGLRDAIKREYPVIDDLLTIAGKRNIPVHEPFAGQKIGPLTVLSPAQLIYEHLVPQFRKTPTPDQAELERRGIWIGEAPRTTVSQFIQEAATRLVSWLPETWETERLREDGVTAAENESSVVLFGQFGPRSVLLTGDAGNNALRWAADNAVKLGLDLQTTSLVQIPHHGSRRNVSPSILDRIVGPRVPSNFEASRYAIVSAPEDDSTHPRKIVMNAFMRRGTKIMTTQGCTFRYHHEMPSRGWTVATGQGFSAQVEAYA